MPVFGAENIAAPYLPALAVAPLPLCLWWGRAVCTQSASSPLVFAQSLFCEWARLRVSSLLTFVGKFSLSLFFFPLWQPHSLGCYLTLAPSGHSGPVLTLRTDGASHTSLSSPSSLVADASIWGTFLVGAVKCLFSVFFFFPSQLCCPLRFQNSPRTCRERVSYCLETSPPLQLPPQDRSLSLTLLSLFLSFILSFLFLKRVGCLSG